jgi:hypothetical protein
VTLEEAGPGTAGELDAKAAMRAAMQQSFTVRAMVDSGAPVLAFAFTVPFTSVRTASYVALAIGVALAGERAVRRQSLQQVLAGLLGLGIAVLVANKTGKASGFYLPGILQNIGLALALIVSLLVKRPLVGMVVGVADERCHGWRERPDLRRAFTRITAVAAAWYVVKASVQGTLYLTDHSTGLAGARLAMGLPPYVLLIAFGITTVRRALAAENAVDGTPGQRLVVAEGPPSTEAS